MLIYYPEKLCMKNNQYIEITLLPIRTKTQKERYQTIAKIEVQESIPDQIVPLCMEKARKFVEILVLLSVFTDYALRQEIGFQVIEPEQDEAILSGNVLVAKDVATANTESPHYVTFSGSHRVLYADVDGYL